MQTLISAIHPRKSHVRCIETGQLFEVKSSYVERLGKSGLYECDYSRIVVVPLGHLRGAKTVKATRFEKVSD